MSSGCPVDNDHLHHEHTETKMKITFEDNARSFMKFIIMKQDEDMVAILFHPDDEHARKVAKYGGRQNFLGAGQIKTWEEEKVWWESYSCKEAFGNDCFLPKDIADAVLSEILAIVESPDFRSI